MQNRLEPNRLESIVTARGWSTLSGNLSG